MCTPLDAYLKAANIGDADFAIRIGRDRTLVSKLRRGLLKPTLEIAGKIEAESGGAVPMQAWIELAPVADTPSPAAVA